MLLAFEEEPNQELFNQISNHLNKQLCQEHYDIPHKLCFTCLKSNNHWKKCIFCKKCSKSHRKTHGHDDFDHVQSIIPTTLMTRFDELLKSNILEIPLNEHTSSLVEKLYADHETFIINELRNSKENLKLKINSTFGHHHTKNDYKKALENLKTSIQNKLHDNLNPDYNNLDDILQKYFVDVKNCTNVIEKVASTIKEVEKNVDDLMSSISKNIIEWQTQMKTNINQLGNRINLQKSNIKPFGLLENMTKGDTYFNNPTKIYHEELISQSNTMLIIEKSQININNDTKSSLSLLSPSEINNLKSYYYEKDNTKLNESIIKLYIDQVNIELENKLKEAKIFLVPYADREKEIERIIINRKAAKLTETHIFIYDIADSFFYLIQLKNNDLFIVNLPNFEFVKKIDSIVSCLPNFDIYYTIKSLNFQKLEMICELTENHILLNIEDSVPPVQTQTALHNKVRERLALCVENNLQKASNILSIKKNEFCMRYQDLLMLGKTHKRNRLYSSIWENPVFIFICKKHYHSYIIHVLSIQKNHLIFTILLRIVITIMLFYQYNL